MPNNLKNTEATRFRAGSEQVEIARKGGVASGIARRKKNASMNYLKEILAYKPEMTPKLAKSISSIGGDPENSEYDLEKLAMVAIVRKAIDGDMKAVQYIHEFFGEDPKTRIEMEKISVQKEAVEAMKNSDGFIDAMKGIVKGVFDDGGDTPDSIEDSE